MEEIAELIEKIGVAEYDDEVVQHSSVERQGQQDKNAEKEQDWTVVTAVLEPPVGTAAKCRFYQIDNDNIYRRYKLSDKGCITWEDIGATKLRGGSTEPTIGGWRGFADEREIR